MAETLRSLLQPMHLPALLTWGAVWLSFPERTTPALWTAMFGFLAAHLALGAVGRGRPGIVAALFLSEAACAIAAIALAPGSGTTPALLVVVVAQLAMAYSVPTTLLAVVALNAILHAILLRARVDGASVVVAVFLGFQAFAALTARYARHAQAARDRLALVNADLLATRALFADSARDAERLRVARELHDIVGHKLTAMRLNLRALATDPGFAAREEIRIAERLSGELLDDIRGVVQALRDARGLDLATALRALAAPLPTPALRLDIGDDVRVTDPERAEAILRLAQEALTNAARHSGARTVTIALCRDGARLRLRIEDDGRVAGSLREGNGVAGMRERLDALDGDLALTRNAGGALRIDASLPA